jgi:peptide/nickel transport system substrate-binding protein
MSRNRFMLVLGLLVVASMLLTACGPKAETPGTGGTVVPTDPPVPTEPPAPKTFVVCMSQEPADLNIFSDTALVKAAVLEAVNETNGMDTRSYTYQAVWVQKVPSYTDGDAQLLPVEVKVGDSVYDAVSDSVLTIAADSKVNLMGEDGKIVLVDFAATPAFTTVHQSVTWKLVDGLTWEDGTPVTSDDELFSFEIANSLDSPIGKYNYERTESFTTSDAQTFTWVSLPGYTSGTYFIDLLLAPTPRHIYGANGSTPMTVAEMMADETFNRQPLSFGPFKLTEWVAGDHITLVKNPTYFRANEGLPKVDTMIYRFIADTNQLVAQLASGECDLGTQDSAFDSVMSAIKDYEAQGLMTAQVVAGSSYEHIDFNALPVEGYTGFAGSVKNADGTPLFANPDIRRAFSYCIDRQAVIDAAGGVGVIQYTYTNPTAPLYAGDANVTIYPFDPAKGLELLAANGWTDTDGDGILDNGQGQKFSFIHSTKMNNMRQLTTQNIQQQLLENCKIETTIAGYGAEYWDPGPDGLVWGRQYDVGEWTTSTGVEPPCNMYTTTTIPNEVNGWNANNTGGFSNAEFDTACALALNTTDPIIKQQQHALAQKIFSEYLPAIPLFNRAKICVVTSNGEGVIMDPTNNSELWNVENFDVALP